MSRKALLIGINKYGDGNNLYGCVNDVILVERLLKTHFGFSGIEILTDRQATKKAIITALKTLIAESRAGDMLLFQYCGHGTQLPTTSETSQFEPDNLDEALVPYGFNPRSATSFILDDEIADILKGLHPQAELTVIFDSCHSGGALREGCKRVKNRKPRYIAFPDLFKCDDTDLSCVPVTHTLKGAIHDISDKGNVALISGCRSDQTSADAQFGNVFHGALTFYLCQTLVQSDFNVAYTSLITQINTKLQAEGFEQESQLEAANTLLNKKFLR